MKGKKFACIVAVYFFLFVPAVHAQDSTLPAFTAEELQQYDGKEGRKAYTAFEGKVYDLTESKSWKNGEHYGVMAGKDATGMMGEAPHGSEVLAKFKVVGRFQNAQVKPTEAIVAIKSAGKSLSIGSIVTWLTILSLVAYGILIVLPKEWRNRQQVLAKVVLYSGLALGIILIMMYLGYTF